MATKFYYHFYYHLSVRDDISSLPLSKSHFSHATYGPSDDTGSEMHDLDFDDFGQSTRRLP